MTWELVVTWELWGSNPRANEALGLKSNSLTTRTNSLTLVQIPLHSYKFPYTRTNSLTLGQIPFNHILFISSLNGHPYLDDAASLVLLWLRLLLASSASLVLLWLRLLRLCLLWLRLLRLCSFGFFGFVCCFACASSASLVLLWLRLLRLCFVCCYGLQIIYIKEKEKMLEKEKRMLEKRMLEKRKKNVKKRKKCSIYVF